MLTEKRYEVILNLLNEKNSVTVTEIKELLGISESTIRRDLAALDKAGKLIKVFGGAVADDGGFTTAEPSVAQKAEINKDEKTAIARYAASLIERDDFVYLDAGTTTGQMIDFIKEKSATFVTNAVSHAQRLAAQGYRVYLIGGELKGTTEAGEADGSGTGQTGFCAGGLLEVRECEFGDVCFAGTWGDSHGPEAAGEFWGGQEY